MLFFSKVFLSKVSKFSPNETIVWYEKCVVGHIDKTLTTCCETAHITQITRFEPPLSPFYHPTMLKHGKSKLLLVTGELQLRIHSYCERLIKKNNSQPVQADVINTKLIVDAAETRSLPPHQWAQTQLALNKFQKKLLLQWQTKTYFGKRRISTQYP